MTVLRVLHIDDEPDIRTLVEISLGLDSDFTVRTCESSRDGLAIVPEWSPHLILSDVVMPIMDGPAMLASLRQHEETSRIPVVFMTARAETKYIDHLQSLGAAGVITKPFDPMTLSSSVREHLRAAGMNVLFQGFMQRLQSDVKALTECGSMLEQDEETTCVLANVKSFAHGLAGAAGIFGEHEVGRCAKELLEAKFAHVDGDPDLSGIKVALGRFLMRMRARCSDVEWMEGRAGYGWSAGA